VERATSTPPGRHTHCRDPLHCIIPPHILEALAASGGEHAAWAARALNRDQAIRIARVSNAKLRAGGPREGADALAVKPLPAVNREIRDAKNTENVDGDIVRSEGDADTGDAATDEGYAGLGDTFQFYLDIFDRNSIDDAGMPLRGVVHFGQDFANAFWDGKRMVFGDGDGQVLGRMTQSLDVIGHELTHGVTEDEAGLEYYGQSGALNESMSDVFGSMVKQYKRNETAEQADWLIGAEVWTPGIDMDALRSMKDPGNAYDNPLVGKDPQPAHMRDFVDTLSDNGGVHINSGIPNKAFYNAATKLTGHSWDRAGRIWYASLLDPTIKPTASFMRFARTSVRVAGRLFGPESDEVKAVRESWQDVGLETNA
jgi:Zn-dependent metalloprotease